MLVPLEQIVAQVLQKGIGTKTVQIVWERVVKAFGSELEVLTDAPIEGISTVAGEPVAAGLARVRRGEVVVVPGYDGKYGKVVD